MGVPGLFKLIFEKYSHTLIYIEETVEKTSSFPSVNEERTTETKISKSKKGIDHHGEDLNAMIHPHTQKAFGRPTVNPFSSKGVLSQMSTMKKKQVYPPMETVFKNICKGIADQVDVVRPRKTLILAIDGVAGLAKQTQQRIRRFKSAKERSDRGEKSEEDRKIFDSNCISTGTEFMIQLSEYIKKFVQEMKKSSPLWKDLKVVFSSDRVPGEGEHKIIRLMSKIHKKFPNDTFSIYSPDADLIMLAMGSHIPNIFVLRENNRFSGIGNKTLSGSSATQYLMIDIFQLRQTVINIVTMDQFDTPNSIFYRGKRERFESKKGDDDVEYQVVIGDDGEPEIRKVGKVSEAKKVSSNELSDRLCINDFVFINFFFGNDFFQRVPTMEINDDNMIILLKVYQSIKNKREREMNSKGPSEYIWSLLNDDFTNLTLIRTNFIEFLKELSSQEEMMLSNRRSVCLDTCLFDEETKMDRSLEEYKRVYLLKKQRIEVTTKEGKMELDEFCGEYIKAITFVARYYLNGMPDWHYFFPYHYSPFISHLYDHLVGIKTGAACELISIHLDLHKPFTPYSQLLSILPPSSKGLLPERFQKLFDVDSPIADFYPTSFVSECEGKAHEYEAVVILPFISVSRLLEAYQEAANGIEEEEDTVKVY